MLYAFTEMTTPDRLERLESARRRLGLRQAEIAAALGATQGHYSKVARRRTPPGPALVARLDRWLAVNDPDGGSGERVDVKARMGPLIASITAQFAELLVLVGSLQADEPGSVDDDASSDLPRPSRRPGRGRDR